MNIQFENVLEAQRLLGKKEFYKYMAENIKVSEYLALQYKYATISVFDDNVQTRLMDDFASGAFVTEQESNVHVLTTYDVYTMFDLLFAYTNINVMDDEKTSDNYDLVMYSGLCDFILKACEDDYNTLIEKANKVTGINYLSLTQQLINLLAKVPNVDQLEATRESYKNMDEETLKKMKFFELMNNPKLVEIIEGLDREATQEVMSKSVLEEKVTELVDLNKEIEKVDEQIKQINEAPVVDLLSFLTPEAQKRRNEQIAEAATVAQDTSMDDMRSAISNTLKATGDRSRVAEALDKMK